MNESQIFLDALKLADPAARSAYLDTACAGNAEMRAGVEALLQAQGKNPDFLEQPASSLTRTLDPAPVAEAPPTPSQPLPANTDDTERPGAVLAGRYKLLEQIGEGGMGTVWLAQQSEPMKRLVAVKLIKAGMDSKAVLARFEAERQALALMEHPNIARVLDGGTTPSRRPYFVMDLVKGVPITNYCDDHHLTPRQRVELFVPVCQAVQHAHQKGIIHRDLKPSNVLVALYDGKPVPKVIDFGVAKAAGQPLTERTLVTGFGAIVGTLEYMSPEQAEINQLDIDTRSDIYSLGVLLYELLTGSPPFSRKELEKAGMLEMLRVIREQEPSKPSTKLSTAEGLPTLAANRGTEPAKLTKLVRGELDWIVMKTLEKDRNRRYETAYGLAADVQRYLADEAVLACPPSAGYRLRKFASKNRAVLTTAAAIALLLVAGVAVSTWLAVRATRAEQAESERAEGERLAKLDAQANAKLAGERLVQADAAKVEAQAKEAEANAVVKFFNDKVFAAAGPKGQDGGLGKEVSLCNAIAASLPALGQGFADQPLVEARLRLTLGNTFSYLAEHEQARDQFEQSRALFTRHRGPDHPDTLTSMNNLANSYENLNRRAEALRLCEEVLEIRKRVLHKDHPDTLRSMGNLANSYAALNRPAEALKLREEVLEIQKQVLPKDHPDTLRSMHNLAISYEALNRPAEALKLNEEVLEIQKRVLPKDHPDTLLSMNNLAASYAALNRPAEALKLREEVLAIQKRVLPKDHPDTLLSMHNLANSYAALNRPAEALTLREEVLAIRMRVLPKDHPDTLGSMHNLANSYAALNRPADALRLHEETLVIRQRVLPQDHPDTLMSMGNLAVSYAALNRPAEALKLREEVLAIQKRVLPKDHPDTLHSMNNLANSYAVLNRHAEALKLREEVLAIQKRVLPKDHPDTLNSMHNLANRYAALNRPAEALKLREEVLAIRKRVLPKDHPDTLNSMWGLAASLIKLDRGAEAIPLIDECVAKAAGQAVDPRLIPGVMALRMGHFRKVGDPAGCRATAAMWEKLNRSDAGSLYNAARFRSVTSGVQAKTPVADAARLAREDADKAMAWLTKAVAAGYKDRAHLETNADFDPLRQREDFKKLLAILEGKKE